MKLHAWLFIPGPLPGLNELLAARGSVGKFIPGTAKRVNSYGELKKRYTAEVQTLALLARLRPGDIPPAHFTFLHFEQDKLRDPDNFCGGAQKLLLDALKEAKLIRNDGWRDVLGIRHHWLVHEPIENRQAVGVQLFAADRTLEGDEALERACPVLRRVELIPRARPPQGPRRATRPKGAAHLAR